MDRLNVHCPAEWEPQKRTWLAWPHHRENWGSRPEIIDFYVELIQMIRRFQPVALIVPESVASTLPGALKRSAPHPVDVIILPTNDIWIRDYGPIFIRRQKASCMISFEFNAWGEKFPPYDTDNQVPSRMAVTLGRRLIEHSIVFEGGAIEVNGEGLGITTHGCLVGPFRNPEGALNQVLKVIKNALGLKSLLVLKRGLFGDHTDGHIDNVARFLTPNHLLIASESDPDLPNYTVLSEALARAEQWCPEGRRLEISTLPLPPQRVAGTETLPASYMNFIYVNGGIIVPLYQSGHDDEAVRFFQRIFPKRQVMGIDCTLVIEEGGSLHCLSKQEPLL